MAGDWIKIEHATSDKPEIGRIAEILGIDHDAAFGKVLRFWVWADQQAVSGNALSVTKSTIDRVTHCQGFADALLKVDWLQARSGSFAIPRFDRHNGQTSKLRAETNRRVTEHRKRKCNGDTLQKPLPEKRREEKKRVKENKARGSESEIKGYAVSIGLPESDGEACFLKWEGNGWTNKGEPVKCWKSTMRNWKLQNFLPSQKPQGGDLFAKPKHIDRTNGYNERKDF